MSTTNATVTVAARRSPVATIAPAQPVGSIRSVVVLGVLVIALQRIGIPVGAFSIPVSAVIVLVFVVVMLSRRQARISPTRTVMMLLFAAAGFATAIANDGGTSMISSLAFALALWTPAIVVEAPSGAGSGAIPSSFALGMVAATALGGVLGAVQSGWSLVTGNFFDPLAALPAALLIPGYKSAQSIDYGGSWMKANGVLFLEPSFLSLFSALALLVIVAGMVKLPPGARGWTVTALIVGLFTSVAISGVLVIPAIVIAVLRSVRTVLLAIVVSIGVYCLVSVVPVAQAFINRLFFLRGSNDARLTRPYEELLGVWVDGPIWFGYGPGTARDLADLLTAGSWQTEVTTPTIAKLLFEYGIVGGGVWLVLVTSILVMSGAPFAVKLGFGIALLIPTDGLTSHVIVPSFIFILMAMAAHNSRHVATRVPPLIKMSQSRARVTQSLE
ncbi:hypothetical protein [Microbacterium rhizomatis]|uniref:O-antigen ligase family protein n=1 Tax=Microbacterium rhizomatis TaxID=1631477 RepID=A0A5J5IZT4_9MICO|nr:hypothetical protein [Microbacterium rhizomatis]KAA9107796.1 hypothetical protein F6B43_10175 [Microbacterium rhizomatis]